MQRVIQERVKMFWIKSLLLWVMLLTCAIALSSALECYDCNSETEPACDDPFYTDKVTTTCTRPKEREDAITKSCVKGVFRNKKRYNEISSPLSL